MIYNNEELLEYVRDNDVKFIRLAFTDIGGAFKNIAIMPSQLERALDEGITLDPRALGGAPRTGGGDLLLRPDPTTLTVMPWRPQQGRVVRLMCDILATDGSPCPLDGRAALRGAVRAALERGYTFRVGTACEFYLFETDDKGYPTHTPQDYASYCDVAPLERAENVRRDICLTLEEMGIAPESSHHEAGPGQNEVDFAFADPLSAADNVMLFKTVVRTVASLNGLHASFMPRPLTNQPCSGMHIHISAYRGGKNLIHAPETELSGEAAAMTDGILRLLPEMAAVLNPITNSYDRLSSGFVPARVGWARDHSQAIRIPYAHGARARIELRTPDSALNPYLGMTLIIAAALSGLDGNRTELEPGCYRDADGREYYIPADLRAALTLFKEGFAAGVLPGELIKSYAALKQREIEFVENALNRETAENELYFARI